MLEEDKRTVYGTTRLTSNLWWSPLFILVFFFCKCSELETSAIEEEENKTESVGWSFSHGSAWIFNFHPVCSCFFDSWLRASLYHKQTERLDICFPFSCQESCVTSASVLTCTSANCSTYSLDAVFECGV